MSLVTIVTVTTPATLAAIHVVVTTFLAAPITAATERARHNATILNVEVPVEKIVLRP